MYLSERTHEADMLFPTGKSNLCRVFSTSGVCMVGSVTLARIRNEDVVSIVWIVWNAVTKEGKVKKMTSI